MRKNLMDKQAMVKSIENMKHKGVDLKEIVLTFTEIREKNATMIKNELHEALGKCLQASGGVSLEKEINDCTQMNCVIDESNCYCQKGKIMAEGILTHLTPTSADIKKKVLPLQGELWLSWSKLQKKERRAFGKEKKTSPKDEIDKIRTDMNSIREKQLRICQKPTQLVKTFIKELSTAYNDNSFFQLMPYFLFWLKFHLDHMSRDTLPALHKGYQRKWQEHQKLKTKKEANLKMKKQEMTDAEQQLADASFGLEHMFREVGQMYEAVYENRARIEKQTLDEIQHLPNIMANLLIAGFPFELMDGDASNIPISWIESIFSSLERHIGNKRVFIVSVLGVQSSGKSTLLNTMFGLQFAVSAGRCTRGVYMQLLKVENTPHLPFDYILVVDTEGLRAPELGQQKYDHDNEIATLVIGLGDVTVVNIKGENYAEMKDVIQVAVHAFLRMKLVTRNKKEKRKCLFLHQNVPAANADDKMRHGCQKLQEGLDEMAIEAALQENNRDIRSFAQIIDFDCFANVWFFPDLWHGNPPMAYANQGYTEKVKQVKHQILYELCGNQKTFLSFRDISQRIKDLWTGILADDFVFCFRNVVEAKAYSFLEKKVLDITWSLEEQVNTWLKEAESIIVGCVSINDAKVKENEEKVKLTERLNNLSAEKEETLKEYFLHDHYADIICQWREQKMNKLRITTDDLKNKLSDDLSEFRKRQDLEIMASKNDLANREVIMRRASRVAENIKGKGFSHEQIREEFEAMWLKLLETYAAKKNATISHEQITKEISGVLFETFPQHRTIVKKQLDVYKMKEHKHLAGSFDITEICEGDYFTFTDNRNLLQRTLWEKSTAKCFELAYKEIDAICRQIEIFLSDLKKTDTKFLTMHVKKLLGLCKKLPDCVEDESTKISMFFLHELNIKFAVHVCKYAYPYLCELQTKYDKKHGYIAMIERVKDTTWKLFESTVSDRKDEYIVADLFCDFLKERINITISKGIRELVVKFGIQELASKEELIRRILTHLAEKEEYYGFDVYITEPKDYSLLWVNEFIDKHYFGTPERNYWQVAKNELNKLKLALLQTIERAMEKTADDVLNPDSSLNMKTFIEEFCALAKHLIPINTLQLQHVMDRKIADKDNFFDNIKNNIDKIHQDLVHDYGRITNATVNWGEQTVYKQISERLWGCDAACPFCKEPCRHNDPKHAEGGVCHICVQHRPSGVSGWHKASDQRLTIEVCNYKIRGAKKFSCSKRTCGTFKACKAQASNQSVYHPYKEYKKHIPDWDIPPAMGLESNTYWLWMFCTFNYRIAESSKTELALIPEHWMTITKKEAIDSLKDKYSQEVLTTSTEIAMSNLP